MKRILIAAALIAATSTVSAQNTDPVDCAACHGQAGVSVSDDIPNLAAQKAGYLEAQLKAFRDGERSNALMNAIASDLSDEDIAALAAHFSALPSAEPGAAAEGLAALDGTLPTFPSGFDAGYVKYMTKSFPERKQVRHYWADPASAAAAKAGQDLPDGATLLVEVYKAKLGADGSPLTDADGNFKQGDLALYTAMQKIVGSGADVPSIYANGDWRYALFTTDRAHRAGTNEAKCLACHKPEHAKDYVFSLDKLAEFAKEN